MSNPKLRKSNSVPSLLISPERVRDPARVLPSTGRVRKPTEKGKEWQLQTFSKKFRDCIKSWKDVATDIEQMLQEGRDARFLRRGKDHLQLEMNKVNRAYDELCLVAEPDDDQSATYMDIEDHNDVLMSEIQDRILALERDANESSHISGMSRYFHESQISRGSRLSEKAKLAAEVASLKIEVEHIELEQTREMELSKMKADLDRIKATKKLRMAEARMKAAAETEDEHPTVLQIPVQQDKPQVEFARAHAQYNSPNIKLTSTPMNPAVREFTPQRPFMSTIPQSPHVNHTAEQDFTDSSRELIQSLTTQVMMSRLPTPEPGIFDGDPLTFPGWIQAFNTLIEYRGIPYPERLHYLKRYLGGEARDAVEGFFLLSSESAYMEAKELLKERYGNDFTVSSAFRDKLDGWPKLQSHDGPGLRKLSDFLKQCDAAKQSISGLGILDDERENRKLLVKLPEWLVNRWARKAADHRKIRHFYPTFRDFSKFIKEESDIACDPITSVQSLKQKEVTREKSTRSYTSKARSLSTATEEETVIHSPGKQRETKPNTAKQSEEIAKRHSDKQRTCPLCKAGHDIERCDSFAAKPLEERKAIVKEKALCFACLIPGHRSRDCRRKKTCSICTKRHPTLMHEERTPSIPSISHFNTDTRKGGMSTMTVPIWLSHKDNPEVETLIFALLDSQSDTSFILEDTCQELDLKGSPVQLKLSTMSSENIKVDSLKLEGLMARAHDSDKKLPLPALYSRNIMPVNRSHIPSPKMARQWPHLRRIAEYLLSPDNIKVGILIGYNCPRALAPKEVILPSEDGPYAQRTELGWGIVGVHSPEDHIGDPIGVSHHILMDEGPRMKDQHMSILLCNKSKEIVTCQEVSKLMERDFNDRQPDASNSLSQEDRQFLKLMTEGIHQSGTHYEMPLPFKTEANLPNNRDLAKQRLSGLKRRLKQDMTFRQGYEAFMERMFTNGHAEKVPEEEKNGRPGCVWYIPHHAVFKKPSKIRIVFDASARYNGISLNDVLLSGPVLTNSLIGVLMRFRQERIAVACDVEQMFYQFYVNPEHRDYFRFLWYDEGDYDSEPTDYRMRVHIFGATSSPSCANFALKQIATDNQEQFGEAAANFISQNFYVDDGLISLPTEADAISLIKDSQAMCAQGGLRLHKFVCNSKAVLEHISPEDQSEGVRTLDLLNDDLPTERTLGVEWDVESDSFRFPITLKNKPQTRRGILSTISSIYDPLGLVAPFVLKGKQILQDICRQDVGWDTPLPTTHIPIWECWTQDLVKLKDLSIHRSYKPEDFGPVKEASLHHFSDASCTAYGQCSYLRLVDDEGRVHCTLVMGKSRVAPLKAVSIPRLELTAAVLSVRISCIIQAELTDKIPQYFWTDSMLVLAYIRNESTRFKTFVGNRVQMIRDHTEVKSWRYVPTQHNPADDASRGLRASDMPRNSRWYQGPSFLLEDVIPDFETENPAIPENDPEIKAHTLCTQNTQDQTSILDRLKVFSDWHQARRAIAACLKLKRNLRSKVNQGQNETTRLKDKKYQPCTVENLQEAEREIIRLTQQEAFPEEIITLSENKPSSEEDGRGRPKSRLTRKSSIYRLDPYLDEEGILRVGGRIKRAYMSEKLKHPILLPKNNHVSTLIIRFCHESVCHQGRGMTLNAVRSRGYWIIACTSAVAKYISNCVTCRRAFRPTEIQKMADLPEDRLEPVPPFTYCGVDLFGPWLIKEGRRELKRYGVLFTCMNSRAIHIEVANSLSTDSFINALRRFLAIRGPIRQLRSDRGTNFVGAQRELEEGLSELDQQRIREFLLPQDCDYFPFKMNAPSASHAGGIWERQIRSVRRILQTMLMDSGSQLDDESFRTLMSEAAAVVNSRPLTVDNLGDVRSLNPLTPNHLITMKSQVLLPPPGHFQQADMYSRKRWRRVQHLVNEFWSRWKAEYLQSQQTRQKWVQDKRDIEVDDIVLIKDAQLPRNQWRLARVEETFPGTDGHVRHARLLIADSALDAKGRMKKPRTYLERPIQKLVLLVDGGTRQGPTPTESLNNASLKPKA